MKGSYETWNYPLQGVRIIRRALFVNSIRFGESKVKHQSKKNQWNYFFRRITLQNIYSRKKGPHFVEKLLLCAKMSKLGIFWLKIIEKKKIQKDTWTFSRGEKIRSKSLHIWQNFEKYIKGKKSLKNFCDFTTNSNKQFSNTEEFKK